VIYSPSKFVFIHIPRTAGLSITQALASRMLELGDVTINISGIGDQPSGWWRHSRACDLAETIPQWDSLHKFAVMRNPVEIVESFWRLVQRDRVLLERPQPEFPESARDYFAFLEQSSRMTFDEWVPWHFRYLEGSGGFWNYWCCGRDGADLGVEVIRFERLEVEWPRICERLGLRGVKMSRVNGAAGRVEWTKSAVRTVRELCVDDIERSAYEPRL